MTRTPSQPRDTSGTRRWKLWVDGCGGFLIVMGTDLSVGRADCGSDLDVSIRADVPRLAGTISCENHEYFWLPSSKDKAETGRSESRKQLVTSQRPIEGLGTARLSLVRPSPLCSAAVLSLGPPHRFGEHVDGVLLVNDTWLIGATTDCHVRCRSADEPLVVVWKESQWWVKSGFSGQEVKFSVGARTTIGPVTMMLEEA